MKIKRKGKQKLFQPVEDSSLWPSITWDHFQTRRWVASTWLSWKTVMKITPVRSAPKWSHRCLFPSCNYICQQLAATVWQPKVYVDEYRPPARQQTIDNIMIFCANETNDQSPLSTKNGKVERYNRTLVGRWSHYVFENQNDWTHMVSQSHICRKQMHRTMGPAVSTCKYNRELPCAATFNRLMCLSSDARRHSTLRQMTQRFLKKFELLQATAQRKLSTAQQRYKWNMEKNIHQEPSLTTKCH